MAMTCSCGAAIGERTKFCPACGKPVERQAQVQPPPAVRAARLATPEPVAIPAAKQHSSKRRLVVIAAVVVLVAAAAAAAVIVPGQVGGKKKAAARPVPAAPATLSDQVFLATVNGPEMRSLTANDTLVEARVVNVSSTAGGWAAAATTGPFGDAALAAARQATIVAARLSALTNLSSAQIAARSALLSFVIANRDYDTAAAQAATNLDPGTIPAAAAAVMSAAQLAHDVVPQATALPSPVLFNVDAISRSVPATPVAQPIQVATAAEYVSQVDQLLAASFQTLQSVKLFVPNVVSGRTSTVVAIAQAEEFIAGREQAIETVLRLRPPAAFRPAQKLLLQSFRLSLSDDRALLAWVQARANGGNATAALDEVNRIGSLTTAAKQQFRAVYGPERQAASGRRPESLPSSF
jgi:hypothetical protein